MNPSEAKIHALNARARALSAEIDLMKAHDAANDRMYATKHTVSDYKAIADAIYGVEQEIYGVIAEGWL